MTLFNPARIRYDHTSNNVHTYVYDGTVIHTASDGQHVFVQLDMLPSRMIVIGLLTWFGIDMRRAITCYALSGNSRYYVQDR